MFEPTVLALFLCTRECRDNAMRLTADIINAFRLRVVWGGRRQSENPLLCNWSGAKAAVQFSVGSSSKYTRLSGIKALSSTSSSSFFSLTRCLSWEIFVTVLASLRLSYSSGCLSHPSTKTSSHRILSGVSSFLMRTILS